MAHQSRQYALEILQSFSLAVAEQMGERLGDYLYDRLLRFVGGFSEPQKTFQVLWGGAYFQTSKETFLRVELPKTLEYLVNLSPQERAMRLQTAMQQAGGDPEEIVIWLIRTAQEERRSKLRRR